MTATTTSIISTKGIQNPAELFQRLSIIFDGLNEAILLEDENREILMVNQAFCDLFAPGVEPSQMIGHDCSQAAEQAKGFFLNPNSFVERVNDIHTSRKDVLGDQLNMADGKILARDYIPIFHEGKFIGEIWKYRNITDEKRKEAEREALIEKLEDWNVSKDKMLSILSHDVRGPLSTIDKLLTIFDRKDAEIEQSMLDATFKDVRITVKSARSLLENILFWGSKSMNMQVMDFKTVYVYPLVKKALDLYKIEFQQKEIEIKNLVDIESVVYCDKDVLFFVIRNLVQNALKYTEGGTISLEFENGPDSSIISVKDEGTGMEADKIDILLNNTGRYNAIGTRGEKGAGVGLGLCMEFVERMKGELKIESVPNEGSVFSVVLPNIS